MGNAVACTPNSKEDTLERIEEINPEEWTQSEVTQWLKLTHDGDLSDLVQPFKLNKISGLTYVRLTNDDLKSKLGIKQFGLRDAFISARDQVLNEYTHKQQNQKYTAETLDNLAPLNTTINRTENNGNWTNSNSTNSNTNTGGTKYSKIPSASQSQTGSEYIDEFERTKYSNSSKENIGNHYHGHIPTSGPSVLNAASTTRATSLRNVNMAYSPTPTANSPDVNTAYNNNNSNDNTYTSSDYIFTNPKYLYIYLCRIVVNGYCRQHNIGYIDYGNANSNGNDIDMIHQTVLSYYFEYDRHIEQFGHDLWKTLVFIEIATIQNVKKSANKETAIRGFTGYRLIKHIKQYLQRYAINKSDRELEILCSSLITYSYIRLAAVTDDKGRLIEKVTEKDKNNFNKNIYVNSKNYLYQFENKRHREFIKSDEPDRQSWFKGCDIRIFSSTLNQWTIGTVINIDGDQITIQYGQQTNKGQMMQKVVDRYQDNVVKSTPQFIYARKNWIKDSQLEVFSNKYKQWCPGRIGELLPGDILRVFYYNHNGKEFNKYMQRWSCDLREAQNESITSMPSIRAGTNNANNNNMNKMNQQQPIINTTIAKKPDYQQIYKNGTKVLVWSNSKQLWIPGVVIQVFVEHKVVNVRYGDFEKLMPWSSCDLKLPY